ncbi:MAG: BCD family MFS transporter [Oscillatoriales cyanobacterium SM2_2_1]|nr:BCD family MFS transporter [Oscillatoriales cyanobacterium SM2_2_1]
MFRLGLFQMGLGMMSLLTLGVLNRIMIDELKVVPILAATAIAMHQVVAPARVWFGQLSDTRPLWGHHRSGYVWLGAALFTSLSFVILQVIWQIGLNLQVHGWDGVTYAWLGLCGGLFGLYGVALSMSSTPFAALLVDVSDEAERPQLIGVVWSMLMVGIVLGAIISAQIIQRPELCGTQILTYDPTASVKTVDLALLQASINPLFTLVPTVVFGLSLLATWGIERRYSRLGDRTTPTSLRDDQITLGRALKILTANRQTGLFFSFLLVMTLSLFMQDAILEPFGGEVFGLCVADTTRLNAFWGSGTLVGIGLTGFVIAPRLGKMNTTRWGCLLAALSLSLIIIAGFTANATFLRLVIAAFGFAVGLLTVGATNLMLDLTAAETAGTFIGAWGLSQAMARALATILGGGLLSLGKGLFPNPAIAYGLVFFTQIMGFFIAINLLRQVNVREFQTDSQRAIATTLEAELD